MIINYEAIKNIENNNGFSISKNVKPFNYGLAILKSILAFYAIVSHNFNKTTTKNKVILYTTSIKVRNIPAFVIKTFY